MKRRQFTLMIPMLIASHSLPTTADARSTPGQTAPTRLGPGSYSNTLRPGGEREPPPAAWRNGSGPVQSNQWYSSLLFSRWSQPLFAQPLSYQCDEAGFQLGVPEKSVSRNPARDENDISYPHLADLVITPLGFTMQDARAGKISDWALDIIMGDGKQALTATIAHGSPYSYYRISSGAVRLLGAASSQIFYRQQDVIGIKVQGKPFAIFLPAGAQASISEAAPGQQQITLQFPATAQFFSIAALPDAAPATVAEFARYAFAFITDTTARWQYDEAASQVVTRFQVSTQVMQGSEQNTLLGLYPHQWHANTALPPLLPWQYHTVRGPLKLLAGREFRLQQRYHGLLPLLPGLQQPQQKQQLAQFIQADMQAGPQALLGQGGTYWQGKGLGRATQLMLIAEQQGDLATRDALLAAIKARMESWLRGNGSGYFHYNRELGTLIGYPDEYGSASELNDHHFHYGYWIFAAAQIALRDPAWASPQQWGGMINLLALDIATHQRNDPMFPFLRHMDVYEGHSWASGTAPFYEGNNQESTSEAIHAWAGLILWGEATANTALRDTGIFLYTMEIHAAEHYWFDLHRLVFAREYQNRNAGILWGSQYVHTTWFTEDPREIAGINFLPLTGASLYLGRDPAFIKRHMAAIEREFAAYLKSEREQHVSPQIWQDILLGYLALADPQAALAQWDARGLVEQGETASHTFHWISNLQHLGQPHFGITANTPLFAVFRREDGRLTYLAYNGSAQEKQVHFSDGTVLRVAARSLAQTGGAAAK